MGAPAQRALFFLQHHRPAQLLSSCPFCKWRWEAEREGDLTRTNLKKGRSNRKQGGPKFEDLLKREENDGFVDRKKSDEERRRESLSRCRSSCRGRNIFQCLDSKASDLLDVRSVTRVWQWLCFFYFGYLHKLQPASVITLEHRLTSKLRLAELYGRFWVGFSICIQTVIYFRNGSIDMKIAVTASS